MAGGVKKSQVGRRLLDSGGIGYGSGGIKPRQDQPIAYSQDFFGKPLTTFGTRLYPYVVNLLRKVQVR